MLIIGENLNGAIKSVAEAINARNTQWVQDMAKAQDAAGADYIDVNSGAAQTDKNRSIADMEWLVRAAQEATEKPLALDADNPEVLKAAVRVYKRDECIINSVTAEQERLEAVAPLALGKKALLVALAMGKGGIPKKVEERLAACDIIMNYLTRLGLKPEQVLFDPLVLPVAVDSAQGMVTLKTLEAIKTRYPGARTTMGLSNISFGLPLRKLVNRSFLQMAIYAGLDSAILNPLDKKIMSALKAAELLAGKDPFCRKYIGAHRKGNLVE